MNAGGSRQACLMGIDRNTRSLPDFPEFAQQLGMVSPELHAASPARNTRLPEPFTVSFFPGWKRRQVPEGISLTMMGYFRRCHGRSWFVAVDRRARFAR